MMNGMYRRIRPLLLGAAACFAFAAESPKIGVQLLGGWPTGSMRSDFTTKTGYGAGVFADWTVAEGRIFRLAYDGLWYGKDNSPDNASPAAVLAEGDRNCRSHSFTAQYLIYPLRDTEGFYCKVGLGGMNQISRIDSTLTSPGNLNSRVTLLQESGTRLNCLAGIGYDFNEHWGAMAQYSFITVDTRTLGSVQTGISYRF